MFKLKHSTQNLVSTFLDNIAKENVALYPLVHHIQGELGARSWSYGLLNLLTAKYAFRCYFGMFLDGFKKIAHQGWYAAPEILGGPIAAGQFQGLFGSQYPMTQLALMKQDLKRVVNDPAPFIPDGAR